MKNKGFSLVELIVVIAIMAILVGVAVPVYTSYISKAQKNKDIQMVDEIKHAVEIAAIGDKWIEKMPNGGVVGTIVITEDGLTVNDEDDTNKLLEKAINDTFGENNSIKLSYDEWTGTLNATGAQIVINSAYAMNENSVSGLLDKVQSVTDAFVVYRDTNGGVSSAVESYLTSMNIDMNDSQQVANGMVLYVSDDAAGMTNDEKSAFVSAWLQGDFSSLNMSAFSKMAAKYAYVEAVVNRMNCQTLSDEFDNLPVISIGAEDNSGDFGVTDPMSVLGATDTHDPATCATCVAAFSDVTPEKLEADANAYLELLGQVSRSQDLVLANKNSSTLYTDSPLVGYVESYVSVADLVKNENVQDGDVVLVVTIDAFGCVTVNTYPLDY